MLKKANAIQKQMIEWRRDFHMHPELGFQETRTAAKVAEIMEGFGYRVRTGVGKTGVVADIGSGSPTIAIRADMDALPLQEANEVPYCSQNPGVMHACGHDAHTAMALGTALLLTKEKFPGTVRFLFQPSEEVADAEGFSGAPRMVEAGAMEGVDLVIAQHVDPFMKTGAISIDSGSASGGVDSWFGTITGKGGHGASPHYTVDPFYLSAHVMLALNAIVSRRLDPFDPAVVSIGFLNGGHVENVIPEQVKMTGTLRYTEKKVQKKIHAEIKRAFEVVRPLGGKYELKFEIGTPPMINSPKAADLIAEVSTDLLGRKNVHPFKKGLGAEDFGCFTELAPGAMFGLGVGIKGSPRSAHNPYFDIDESAMPIGAAIIAESALRFLRRK